MLPLSNRSSHKNCGVLNASSGIKGLPYAIFLIFNSKLLGIKINCSPSGFIGFFIRPMNFAVYEDDTVPR